MTRDTDIKFDSRKKHLFDYVQMYHQDVSRSEFESYIRYINQFRRPINETIHRLSYCPWVFVRYISRRKTLKMGFFKRLISNRIEKIELKYYGL